METDKLNILSNILIGVSILFYMWFFISLGFTLPPFKGKTYDCNRVNGQCIVKEPFIDEEGSFKTEEECKKNCDKIENNKYSCDKDTKTCFINNDLGEYDSLQNCNTNCEKNIVYKCESNQCIRKDLDSESREDTDYDSKIDCLKDCENYSDNDLNYGCENDNCKLCKKDECDKYDELYANYQECFNDDDKICI